MKRNYREEFMCVCALVCVVRMQRACMSVYLCELACARACVCVCVHVRVCIHQVRSPLQLGMILSCQIITCSVLFPHVCLPYEDPEDTFIHGNIYHIIIAKLERSQIPTFKGILNPFGTRAGQKQMHM